MKFNGITEISVGLKVKDIKRSMIAPIKNRLLEQKGNDKLYDFGSTLGANRIDITFHAKEAKTKIELQAVMRAAAAWLFPLDRRAKKLELDEDNGLFYMAKLDGGTELTEILSYGYFTASFICIIPYKIGTELNKAKSSSFSFTRASIAYNELLQSVAINVPRYFSIGAEKGLLIEEGSPANIAYNPTFASASGLVPTTWSEKLLNATGTSSTVNGVYRATITNFSDVGLGYYGAEEQTGGQHTLLLADIWSISVKARVISGNIQARLRAVLLDTTYNAIDTSGENKVTASTEWTELKIENKNYPNQKVLGIRVQGFGSVAGASGVVEFKEPIYELGKYVHRFKLNAAQLAENASIDITGLAIPLEFGIGITYKPDFSSSGVQIAQTEHTLFSLYKDATNYLSVYIDAVDKKIKAKSIIAGNLITLIPSGAAPTFTNTSIIKVYFHKSGTDIKFYIKIDAAAAIDSGTITDARAVPAYTKIFIGSINGAFYANGVLRNFIFDDAPAPTNYLV